MVRVRYVGVQPEVEWQKTIFKRNEWKEIYNISLVDLPFDFEIEGMEKKSEFDELKKIKGIGEETLADIKRIFSSIEKLKESLEKDKCPLRNDICEKLKKFFGIGGKNG